MTGSRNHLQEPDDQERSGTGRNRSRNRPEPSPAATPEPFPPLKVGNGSPLDRRPTITFAVPTRESARVKAARLLLEGRVKLRSVRAGRCWATVNGDTGVYEVGCAHSRWFCSCENLGACCSHIQAVRAVVDLRGTDPPETTR